MLMWALGGSYLLFNVLMIGLLWGNAWLPPGAGIAALAFIVIAWSISAHFLFWHLRLTARQKTSGWLFVFAFVGYSIARRFSHYYIFHSSWLLWLFSDAVGLLFVAASVGLGVFILGKHHLGSAATYTVESETPDHVLHMSGTPNYSVKRTAAERLR